MIAKKAVDWKPVKLEKENNNNNNNNMCRIIGIIGDQYIVKTDKGLKRVKN